jgi:hypothetical protein
MELIKKNSDEITSPNELRAKIARQSRWGQVPNTLNILSTISENGSIRDRKMQLNS